MKAPNGKPTNLNERQWLQVRTTNFKNWFGDWENNPSEASKVVDENGEPLVVYHGTEKEFSVFNKSKGNDNPLDPGFFGVGIYFTNSMDMSTVYGKIQIPAFLNIKNPKIMSAEDPSMMGKDIEENDGVIAEYPEDTGVDWKEYVVPEPNQIKSATDNTGEFSTTDDDIRKFTTPQGEVYGFVDKEGTIYLDETKISPEHPMHEYTHVWDRIVQQKNPELWKRGVDIMKHTSLWKEISESENYGKQWRAMGITGERLDNLIASEVHARFIGEAGAALLDNIAKEKGQSDIIAKLKQWILDFWKNLKATFSNWSQSDLNKLTLKDFNRMTVRDFVEGTLNNTQNTKVTNTSSITKIISGGQTGVDTIGLEVAKKLGIETGGTMTPNFVREKGIDSYSRESLEAFGLKEISKELQGGKSGKDFYLPRTEQNVINSDGTVYFAVDANSAGKIATERFAKQHNKPFILNPTARQLREWIDANNIKTLNVAGNRGSKMPANNKVAQTIENALSFQKNDIINSNTQQLDISTISNNSASFGVTIDTELKRNWQSWQQSNPNGIVAYRVNYNKYNTPEEVNAGRIGNPFSEGSFGVNKGIDTVQKFYEWLVTGNNFNEPKATEEYRQAIINKLLSIDKPNILYYKELGHPSHATVLGYLIEHKELLGERKQQVESTPARALTEILDESEVQQNEAFDKMAKEIQDRTYPVSPAFVKKILDACKAFGVKAFVSKERTESRGVYQEDTNAIWLYKDENYSTSLHELAHAVTAYLFNEYINLPESLKAEVDKIQDIYDFLRNKFIQDNFYENGELKKGINIDKAFAFHTDNEDTYGLKNAKELIAEFVSNTPFRRFLDNEGYGAAYKKETGKDLNNELTSLIGSIIDKRDASIKREAQAQMQNLKSNLNTLNNNENTVVLNVTTKAPFFSQLDDIATNGVGELTLSQESLKSIASAPKAKGFFLTHSAAKGTLIKMNFGEDGTGVFMLTAPAQISGENITLPLAFIGEDYLRTHLLNVTVNDKNVATMSAQQVKEFEEQGYAGFNNVQEQDNPENFNNEKQSEEVISSEKTILSNEELKYWNEQGVGPMPRILVGSERTDPAFHVQEILDVLNGKTTVNEWGVVDGKKQVTGQLSGKDFAGLYLITKHDGLPMLELLQTKIPKLIHFSITSLGGTQYEPGVMKYNDLLDKIQDYIAQGLDPDSVTIRIDPIVPGVTKFEDIETIVRRASEMGIKRIRFSVMDAYQNTKVAMSKLGYDFDKYYGNNFFAKKEYIDEIADFMLATAKKYNVTLGTCAESLVRAGISKEGCLSVGAVNNMLGTSIEDKGTENNTQRKLCSCYGGKIDALQYNNKCASHCIYCYAKHENDKVLEYYNEDGTLKNNVFTQTRKVETPQVDIPAETQSTQPVSTPTQTSTQEKKDFTPEYQLDRSKIEADSRYDKLRSEMSSVTIERRAEHMAKEFSNLVLPLLQEKIDAKETELSDLKQGNRFSKRKEIIALEDELYRLKKLYSRGDRVGAIQEIGVQEIFDKVKADLQEIAEMSTEDFVDATDLDASKQEDFKKYVDNFQALQNYALYYINQREGSKIEEIDESEESEEENGGVANGTEGWSYKVRFVNPYTTASAITKGILNNIPMFDKNGEVVTDDLGYVRTLTGTYAHTALLHELYKIKSPDDFVRYDEQGVPSFPALEDMVSKYPWVQCVINDLKANPEAISIFYTDMRQDFISYWTVKTDSKTGKLSTIPINKASARESVIPVVERNYEYSELQSEDSIFGKDQKVIFENVTKAKELYKVSKRNLKSYTQEDYNALIQNTAELLRRIGFTVEDSDIAAVLGSKDGRNQISNLLTLVSGLLDSVQNYSKANLIEDFKGEFYNPIADIFSIVSEDFTMDSFRDDGKTRYSYSAPNFLNTLVKNLKEMDNNVRKAFMDRHFKQYKWFYDEATGGWKSAWLRALYEDDNIEDRSALEVMNLTNIEGHYYRNWTSTDMTKAFITAYFASPGTDYAWYNVPIFADSPVANLIKMRRVTGDIEDMKRKLLKGFEQVIRQELWRMKLVKAREDAKVSPIVNFDSASTQKTFYFFPELNTYTYDSGEFKGMTFLEAYNQIASEDKNSNPTKFKTRVSSLIQNAVKTIMDKHCESFIKENIQRQGLEEILEKSIVEDSIKDKAGRSERLQQKLTEYYWNNAYAQTQIIEMTTIDMAFYKNDGGIDFQKRFKEIYAAGSKLNTALPWAQGGRKFERTIYIADSFRVSPSFKDIKDVLEKAAEEGKFGKDANIAKAQVDDILRSMSKINTTDGQAYRSLSSFKSVTKMMGKWSAEMEKAFNNFENETWDMSDFYVVWNTLKPYVFTIDDVPTGVDETKFGKTMPVPHQNKNSEFLLLAMYGMLSRVAGQSSVMRGLNRFMEENDIDVAQFESAAKVGGQGIINLNYSRVKLNNALYNKDGSHTALGEEVLGGKYKGKNDYEKFINALTTQLNMGKLTQKKFNEAIENLKPDEGEVMDILRQACLTKDYINPASKTELFHDPEVNKEYNPEVVHRHSYDDYMIAQPTPEHLFDAEVVYGSQIRTLITADLPVDFKVTINGKDYDKKSVQTLYKSLIVENLLEDFEKVKKRFNSIEDFQKALENQIKDNPKYGREVLDAIQLVPDGQGGKKFNIPLNNPSTTVKIQEVINAMFKNGITKQHIKGGACILVSNFGYTDQLHIVYNKENDKASGIKYAECYMPAWSKKYFQDFMDSEGNIDMDRIPTSLGEMIAYRIPTEHKYSMMALRVKGFLPIQNGSCIMLPMETVAFSGEDFDVDKRFIMIPEFKGPTFKGKNKTQFIDDFIEYNKKHGVTISKDDARSLADMVENNMDVSDDTIEADAYDFYMKNRDKYGYNTIRKVEYDDTKTPAENTRAQRNNMLIDIMKGILTSPYTAEQVNHVGNYNDVKKAARIAQLTSNKLLLQEYAQEHNIDFTDKKALGNVLLKDTLDSLDDFIKVHRQAFNPLDPRTFMYFHKQNMAGDALIGMYANNSVAHAKYQEFGIGIHSSFQFTINNNRMTTISPQRTADGNLISFNNAEFLAAAPDNAKDPVLADLLQNPATASYTAAMLRMGMNIQDIGLLFIQPAVRTTYEADGDLSRLANLYKGYLKLIKKYDGSFKVSQNPFITSQELMDNVLNAENINIDLKNEAAVRKAIPYIKAMMPALRVMLNIGAVAEDLNTLTQMSRADSPNGAIAPTAAQALNQIRKVDLFTLRAKKGQSALINVEKVLKNGSVNTNMSTEQLRNVLNESGDVSMLQAFHSLGIELALPLMSRYFSQTGEVTKRIFNQISDQTSRGMMSNNKTLRTSYTVDQLLKDITTFALSGTKFFGNDGTNTYEQKRDYYVYEFPQKFIKTLEQNPDLNDIDILKKLVVKRGKIQLENLGKMSMHTKNRLMSEMDSLLTHKNPIAQELIEDLIKYSYYTEQLNFGPLSFGTFISPRVLNAFPEIEEALRNIDRTMSNPRNVERFISQLYAQYGESLLRSYDERQIESKKGDFITLDMTNVSNQHSVLNPNVTADIAREYIIIKEESEFSDAFEDSVVVSLYKLYSISADGTQATYQKVPMLSTADGKKYDLNGDINEMAQKKIDSERLAKLRATFGRLTKEYTVSEKAELPNNIEGMDNDELNALGDFLGDDFFDMPNFDIATEELVSPRTIDNNVSQETIESIVDDSFESAISAMETNVDIYNEEESIATLAEKFC